jgi:quercetin dioxygenase-like cupin family protein
MAVSASKLTVLAPTEVDDLGWEPLGMIEGVRNKVMWRDGTSMAGLMEVAPGHRLGAHTHRENHHHMWVVDGHVEVVGKLLGPGGYAHIAAGVEHDLDATDTEGCTVYYLYLRPFDGAS